MRNRLIREVKVAQEFRYKATSDVDCYYENDVSDDVTSVNLNDEQLSKLNGMLADVVNDNGPRGLAEHISTDTPLGRVIRLITVVVNDDSEAVTTALADRRLTPDELEQLSEFMVEQFTEGLGEGFEQYVFDEAEGEVEVNDDEYESCVNEYHCALFTTDVTFTLA